MSTITEAFEATNADVLLIADFGDGTGEYMPFWGESAVSDAFAAESEITHSPVALLTIDKLAIVDRTGLLDFKVNPLMHPELGDAFGSGETDVTGI